MNGIIIDINQKRGMVAVQTQTEGISVFEMLSDDNFELSDEVSWSEDKPLGDCDIRNITKDEIGSVYFQNHWVSKDVLKKQMLY